VAQLDPQLGTYDLWLYDSDWRKATRVTFDPGSDLTPVWSEDGARAVFVRDQGRNGWQLEIVNVDRPGLERPLLPEPAPMMLGPLFWKDDVLYYRAVQPGGAARIWMVRTDKIDRPVPTASADPGAATAQARISPNGRWLAYTMNVKDSRVPRAALFVRPWPSGEGRSQVASEGSLPRWRADGGELFFLAPDRHLMAATVRDGAIGPLVPLCPTEALTASGLAGDPYDVAADGQRFLIKVAAHRPSIVVISGWLNGAKR
jgi:hypothetical protein